MGRNAECDRSRLSCIIKSVASTGNECHSASFSLRSHALAIKVVIKDRERCKNAKRAEKNSINNQTLHRPSAWAMIFAWNNIVECCSEIDKWIE